MLGLVVGACSSNGEADGTDAAEPTTTVAAPATNDPANRPILLEPASATGPEPFTPSVAADAPVPLTPEITGRPLAVADPTTGVITGDAPGLYGGSGDVIRCDIEQLIAFLEVEPAKAAAFASVLAIEPTELPATLRGLAPVVVVTDIVVTNHGFVDGRATPRTSVLEAGTAVLIDDAGVARVRCACGNPLAPAPADVDLDVAADGAWNGYDPTMTLRVEPGVPGLVGFVDLNTGALIEPHGPATTPSDNNVNACGTVTSTVGTPVLVVVETGDIACHGALTLAETYYQAPPTPPEGSGAFVQIGMWSCMSTSAATAQASGNLGGCEGSTGRIGFRQP